MAKRQRETESDFEEKVIHINRCSKVVKGGRKFSFSALVVIGDGNGKLGVGFAKANEVADAIRKAGESARKNVCEIVLEGTTIPHEVLFKKDGARVLLKPAGVGTGVIAGSKMRSIFELAGVKDIIAKNLGSNNPLNQVKATVDALMSGRSRSEILAITV